MPLTRRLADWCFAFRLEDSPDDVRFAARRAMLDTLGVMAAGQVHPLVRRLAKGLPGMEGPCSVLCRGRGDAEIAALVNGTAAHVWDFDDTSYTGIMHGSAVVFPVVLALAEERGLEEEELTAAFIVGSEITYTLADICTHRHYFRGWWSTATFGLIGATAAAARLLGLSADQMAHAIGFAAAAAGGGKAVFGTDGKPFLVGETARRAIGLARASGLGLTGPIGAFEDRHGFFTLLNEGAATLSEADTLGRRWRLIEPGLLFKTSPVCSAAHAAIELMARLVSDANISADEIVSIKAEVPELVKISLVYPRPGTIQQAQFSLPYSLACAALHGCVRLADLAQVEIFAADKSVLMDKVTTVVADDLSMDEMRARWPESARLSLALVDGREVEGFCGEAYGMPKRPLTNEDLAKKISECFNFAGLPIQDCLGLKVSLHQLAAEIFREHS
ncbi:MmgE/PrpD family protein [Gammaproteobacteria bacterium]|nr:MmgE/PrpD family protein [Gammaproteobacteria bacterium]